MLTWCVGAVVRKLRCNAATDIKVKEPDFDAMCRGQKKWLPPRFMTIRQCVSQLLEVESRRNEGVLPDDALAIGVARLGQPSQQIISGT